jgi:ferrous iron transport protein B
MQTLIVALIVLACSAYVLWTLMPSALRRSLAIKLLNFAWPASLERAFRKAAQAQGACGGCDSCGDSTAKLAAGTHKITLHRRTS